MSPTDPLPTPAGEYALTVKELDEAFAANSTWSQALPNPTGRRAQTFVPLAILFVVVPLTLGSIIFPDRFDLNFRFVISPIALALSVAIVPAFLLLTTVTTLRRPDDGAALQPDGIVTAPDPKQPSGKGVAARRSLLGWVAFVCLAIVIFIALQSHPSTRPVRRRSAPPIVFPTPTASSGDDHLHPIAGQTLFVAHLLPILATLFLLLWVANHRNKAQKQITQQHVLRETRLTIDEQGLHFDSQTAHVLLRWSGVQKFMEAENVVLLYETPFVFHVIPKRAFATTDDADRFIRLLSQRVGRGAVRERPSAFPIQPLPAIPVDGETEAR